MKSAFASLLTALLIIISGCAKTSGTPDLVKSDLPGPKETADLENELSAKYLYLESRIHLQEGRLEQAVSVLGKAIEKDPESSLLKRDLIRLFLQQGRKQQARELAEKLVKQEPENIDNLMLLVRFLDGDNPYGEQDKELTALLNKILDLAPDKKEPYLRLGKIYMETEQFAKALDLFTGMVQEFPDYYVAHFYLGEADILTGNFGAARKAFLKSLELEPNLIEARFRLADIYRLENKSEGTAMPPVVQEKVLALYRKILEIEPDNFMAQFETAILHYKAKQFQQAQKIFIQLSREAQTDSRPAMVALETFLSDKRSQDAAIAFSQLVKAAPDNDMLHFLAGMAYESAKAYDQAINHYLQVGPDHPDYKKALFTVAFLYRDTDQTPKAVSFLESHHQQDPKDADIVLYLSSLYERTGELDKALPMLKQSVLDAPENTVLLFRLGTVQDLTGLRQDCIETMKEVIKIDPEHAGALNYLGYTYAEMGIHLDQAMDLITRALRIQPEDGYITDSLGWVYFQKQNYEQAVIYLEKAARLSNYEPIIAGHLADAYVKTRQYPQALSAYKKALANLKKKDENKIRELEKKIQQVEQHLEQENQPAPVE